jgi:RNA polymerase sigma-70 factor (subfamily 1)
VGEREIADLLHRAVEGERDAAEELIRRYEGPIRALVHLRLGRDLRGRVDTDDIVQSALTLAVRDLPSFRSRGEAAFLKWLLSIAERKLGMAARFHRAARRDVGRELPPERWEGRPGDRTSPSRAAARDEDRERVRSAVSLLREQDREVVELRSFRGLSFGEIAGRLGLNSEDAARHRYARALRKVGAILSKGG